MEMTRKTILNKRIDIYVNAWSEHARLNEQTSVADSATSVKEALKNLSLSVTSLKRASMISDQVKFFFNYLKQELQELNLLEARSNPGNKQSSVRGGYQNQQGQFKSRYQNFNMIEQRSFGQQQPGPNASRGMGYLPQMNQQFQQSNQHHQQNTPNQQQGN